MNKCSNREIKRRAKLLPEIPVMAPLPICRRWKAAEASGETFIFLSKHQSTHAASCSPEFGARSRKYQRHGNMARRRVKHCAGIVYRHEMKMLKRPAARDVRFSRRACACLNIASRTVHDGNSSSNKYHRKNAKYGSEALLRFALGIREEK